MADTTLLGKQTEGDKQSDAPLRRLDSLARCLEDGQECVAVACISGQLFIAANGLYTSSKKEGFSGSGVTTFPKQTKEIIKHFCLAALGNRVEVVTSHAEVFSTKICTLARFKKAFKQAGSMITQKIYEAAAEHALASKETDRRQLLQSHGHNLLIAGGVYYEAIDLHESFSKIEQGLLGDSKDKFTPEQIESFKKCGKQSEKEYILHAETETGVHAELQILGKIIQLAEKGKIKNIEIYLGISKECCLHCHCMLEVAGKALLEKYNITLTHRGDHDISFEDNWVYPTVLAETTLGKAIKVKFYEKIEASIPKTDTSMGYAQASDSDATPSPMQLIRDNIAALKVKLEVLRTCPFQDGSLKNNISIMELGLSLHGKIKQFKDFFEITPETPPVQINIVIESFVAKLELEKFFNKKEDIEVLVAFFESRLFENPKKDLIISLLKERTALIIAEALSVEASQVPGQQVISEKKSRLGDVSLFSTTMDVPVQQPSKTVIFGSLGVQNGLFLAQQQGVSQRESETGEAPQQESSKRKTSEEGNDPDPTKTKSQKLDD